MTKKWTVDEDDELRLFYGDENFNGKAYPCNDITFMKMIADKLNKSEEENEHLRKIMDIPSNSNVNDIVNVLNYQESDKRKFQKENEHLKQALLFFLAIALTDSSTDYQNDADKWCNILFNCGYEEAKRKYGDFKYEERWDFE